MKGSRNNSKQRGIRNRIRSISLRPPFNLFLNPYFLARRELFRAISIEAKTLIAEYILDVGCGSKPYLPLFPGAKYIGVDINNPGHDHSLEDIEVFYSGLDLPFAEATFDNVLCFQVLEHVFAPDYFLSEIYRVLKPGGVLLLTVPLIWNEHEQPQDFARYTSFGLRHLLGKNDLVLQRQSKLNSGLAAICQLVNAFVASSWRNTPLVLFKPLIFTIFNIVGLMASMFPNRDDSLYLDNLIVAKKERKVV